MSKDTAFKNPISAPVKPKFLALNWWLIGICSITTLACLPLVALLVMAFSGNLDALHRIATTVLPRSSITTVLLLLGIAIVAGTMGTVSAWLVAFFQFPGRKFVSWALMLPLAVPTYISAYAFSEFFAFTGPVQSAVRNLFSYQLSGDYWFPEIRSLPGAIFVLSFVLYPYVYLSVRALFFLQGRRALEAANILGASAPRAFAQVLLPLARPALALGLVLAMMEAINDIGAMQFLGVQTLTFSVFSIWTNQSDLSGAAQLALVLLALVAVLIFAERWARRGQKYQGLGSGNKEPHQRSHLKGAPAAMASAAGLLPIILGFGIPVCTLAIYASRYIDQGIDTRLLAAIATSVSLATFAAIFTVILALFLTYAARVDNTRSARGLVRFASLGYAIPGTIVALGLFLPLASFDNWVDGAMRDVFGWGFGLLITGSGATLIYAYAVRFMAMAEGSIDGALCKISPNLDQAALCYGANRFGIFWRILMPILRPAVATAALLVFIETLKELSATMVLRPFGIETVAIYVHDLATRGRVEQAGIGALMIVLVGLVPVLIISRTALKDRDVEAPRDKI